MRRHAFLFAATALLAAGAAAQPAPTPPVAPPVPQPGAAEPMNQAKPEGISATPTGGKKDQKWDVSARHGPGHDVPIDVTQGTWMNLDVSPDGREIAFDLLGDIYVVPMSGGDARALATGNAWDMQPRYSPSGSEIAFTSDRGGGDNIWVMNRDGSNPRAITKESFRLLNGPDWSPDGNYIVARKHFTSARSLGAGEMWLYHRSGVGAGVQMTKARTKQKDTNEPAFSPDGRYLYFSDDATPGDTFQYSKDPNGQIYVIQRLDRETGEIDTYVSGPGGAVRPTPSPDGKSLAFVRRIRGKSNLMLLDIASGRMDLLTDTLERDQQETWAVHNVYPGISWTPDSKSVVYWAGGRIHRIDVATRAVSDIPFHVTGSRFVEDALHVDKRIGQDSFDVKMVRFAHASPDGRRVVYEALGNLWIKDIAGSAPPRRLTRTDEREAYPTWSRDGRQIAYVAWDDDKGGQIKVIGANGGAARAVTSEPGYYREPAFSPDGRMITYRKGSDGFLTTPMWGRDPGIYVLPLAKGAKAKRVSKTGAFPQFGKDSERVFFVDADSDNNQLFKSVSVTGADPMTHLKATNAAEFALSPNEQFIGWTERYQAYVMPFVRSGRTIDIAADAKALPQTRISTDAGDYLHWSGDGSNLYWTQGPDLFARRVDLAAFDGAKTGPAAPIAHLGFVAASPHPSGTIALTNARIVTMNGDQVIDGGTIIVDGDRIAAVGPAATVAVPAGAKVIDMSGKTILPGLIDAHWHGPHASDQVVPRPELGLLQLTRLRRDDGSRSVRRHPRGVRLGRTPEGRQDPRPAHLLDRDDPVWRRNPVHGRDRIAGRRAGQSAAAENVGRLVGQKLQPAAPRAAPDGHRGGPPTADGSRAGGRLAVHAQHDHDRRRAHDDRALAADPQYLRRRRAILARVEDRLDADSSRLLRRAVRRISLVPALPRLGRADRVQMDAAGTARCPGAPPNHDPGR